MSSVRNQTNALEHTLTQKIRPQLTELADIFDEPVSNQTALSMLISSLDMVQKNITIATNAAGDIRRPLMGISLNHILNVSIISRLHNHEFHYKGFFVERRSIRVDSMARNGCNIGFAFGSVRCSAGRCRATLSLRSDSLLGVWTRRRYRLLVDVRNLSLGVGCYGRLVRRSSRLFGFAISSRFAG